MNIHLLLIDFQNDFTSPKGSLYVPGAENDAERTTALIKRLSSKISDISVTLDSHRVVDVAHPAYWVDSKGNHPSPFTIISVDDVTNGTWMTRNPNWRDRALNYVKELADGGKYPLCIWPEHCLIGSWGHSLYPSICEALQDWERDNFAVVDYCVKGSNIHTEHYGGVAAEVEDPEDVSTMINDRLLDVLEEADQLVIAGEALSHCVASTVRQIVEFKPSIASKIYILEDCCSNVPTFESLGESFINDMKAEGVNFTTADEYLK